MQEILQKQYFVSRCVFLRNIWIFVGNIQNTMALLPVFKTDDPGRVTHGGNNAFQQICGAYTQGRGVDAGVEADILAIQDRLVDDQIHLMI